MILVTPDDLPKHWELVEAGLLEIIRRTQEKWTPVHVKQAINEGWASLFICDDGFVVLQRLKALWTAEPYINVWAMWFPPGKGKARREELVAWLDQITSESKCGWWEFSSPREGWAGLPDCEKARTTWRRKK